MSNNRKAVEAFKAHKNDIAKLVDLLLGELETMEAEIGDHAAAWGIEANAAKIRNDLIAVVDFAMDGDSGEARRSFLDDTRE